MCGLLLVASLIAMQVLVGGTSLLFSLPADGILVAMGLLSLVSLGIVKPKADPMCLLGSAVFFGYILLRALVSPVPYLARADIYSVLGGLIVYFFVALIFTAPRARMLVLGGLLAFAIVHVLIGAIQFRDGNNFMPIPFLQRADYGRRASGFYICPNHLGGLLEVLGAFGLSIVCWSRWPIWAKLLTAYTVAIAFAGIVLTGSRGGYLSTATCLLLLAVLSLAILRRTGAGMIWKIGIPSLVGVALLVGISVFCIKHSVILNSRAQNIADMSNMRLSLWRSAIAEWKLARVFGTGSGTFVFYARKFRAVDVQSDPIFVHNDYLHLLCEYGAAGAVAFLAFLGVHARRGWQTFTQLGLKRAAISPRLLSNGLALNLGALAAVAALVVHSVFDFNLHIPANVLLLAFVFGILANPGLERNEPAESATPLAGLDRLVLPALALVVGFACVRFLPGEYFCEKARISLRDDKPVEAIKLAQMGLEREQRNPDIFYYLGRARVEQANVAQSSRVESSFLEAALKPLQQALALEPNEGSYQAELGTTYDALGRFAEAEWMFDAAMAWDPNWQWLRDRYAVHLDEWKSSGGTRSIMPVVPTSP